VRRQFRPSSEGAIDLRTDVVEIRPTKGLRALGLRELWDYRELVYFFAWRDVKVRYRQTFFGAAWAVIQPLVLMIVFTFVFGRVLNIETPRGVPKPVFYYVALVPWTLFATSLAAISAGVSKASSLVRKIYFPRLILPIAETGAYLIDFMIALSVVFVMMFAYGLGIRANILWLPLLTLLAVLTALAFGIWLAALYSRYKDVAYVVPFLVQVWLFLTPVINQSTQVSREIRPLYFLNPMAGVIEGFRWALIDAAPAPGPMTLVSAGAALALLIGGVYYFRAAERTFADLI
jgi:lipopolysaccharide transport system permease protein